MACCRCILDSRSSSRSCLFLIDNYAKMADQGRSDLYVVFDVFLGFDKLFSKHKNYDNGHY